MLDLTNATLQEWAMNNGLNANIKTMTQAEKTMLRYQYVMSNTARAQGDFQRTSKTWHNQIVILKQQLQQLAAVIGSGLIQAIKPFVIRMNAALSGLIKFAQNVVNALGKIFGWEMDVKTSGLKLDDDMADMDTSGIDDVGDSADDAGNSIDNATKSVKKFKDQLQGFDKLNVLRTTDSDSSSPSSGGNGKKSGGSGSGASGGGGGVSGGDAAAALRKTKGLFESNIDDLFGLGKYISDALRKALAGINWPSIYEKARNFGKGLAEFLNGLINPETFYEIGRTIAKCLNTALHFLDSFGETFDFANFGKSIAYGINGFLWNIDWNTALSAARNWGIGIADAINNLVDFTAFYSVGESIAKAIGVGLEFLYQLGTHIKWEKVGQAIADGINGFFANFPAKKFADTIDAWVQGIFDMVTTAVSKTDWGKVGEKIKEFISNLDFKTVAIVLGALTLIKGASFALAFGEALTAEIKKQFIAQLAAKITAAFATDKAVDTAVSTGLGQATARGISGADVVKGMAGIGLVFGGLTLTFKTFKDMWDNGWTAMGQALIVVGAVIAGAGLVILGVPIAIAAAIGLLVAGVASAAILIKENWDGIKSKFLEVGGKIKESWDGLVTSAQTFGNDMKTQWGNLKTWCGETWDGIKTKTAETWDAVKTAVSNKFGEAKTAVETTAGNLKQGLSSAWDNVKTKTSTTFDSVKDSIANKFGSAKETFSSVLSFVTNSFIGKWQDAWNKVKEIATGIWDAVKNGVKGPINGVISIVEGAINGIISGWNAIKSAINSLSFTVPDWVPNFGGYVVGFNLSMTNGVSLPRFEKGGFPDRFSLFAAGERGIPELLGTVGGRTAVAGGEEITGIRDEIYSTGNRQIALLQRQNSILTAILEKEFGISSRDVFNAVRSEAQDYRGRTGRSAFDY